MIEYFLLVLCMGLVTFIPRMLPMVFLHSIELPNFLQRFLQFVPYAVLASLIFPGILYSVDHVPAAIIGGLASIILAIFGMNLIIIVLGGITAVFISHHFFF
ncbi:AzlD domain-containing protein [Halalkalibacter sp. APA_J-10(15)]|uniref:AzlD domain-containing protein n=1 Tax=unclassified Halalkalibacter TaxID=2893063 RepID=UPI001FF294AB|nr:AzlD domain-containing protein [Halalkalibacter sp. APA_J-10(15)]MCK0472032.1 AzlD domain-containing protein [Halalkalibacter sp. APA_J-10(15)]